MCSYGYTVAGSSTTAYFGSDLIHRLYHTDKVGEGVVGHYADDYEDCLQLAMDNPEDAARNSATLRYFALDVYGFDIAVPGQGCTGEPLESEETHLANFSVSSTVSSSASSAVAGVTLGAASASTADTTNPATPESSDEATQAVAQETATQVTTAASVSDQWPCSMTVR